MEAPVWFDAAHHGVWFVTVYGVEDPRKVPLSEVDLPTEMVTWSLESLEQLSYGLNSEFRLKSRIILDCT
jgi:hypothetical protein